MPACAFADARRRPSEAASNCTAGSVLRRWHATTQELLFAHLRALWPDDRPRVLIDLGSQAGSGLFRNESDALIWLNYFNATGSLVVGVDAFEDYALDLQHRFEKLPYSDLRGVTKTSVHAAVASGKASGSTVDLRESAAYTY